MMNMNNLAMQVTINHKNKRRFRMTPGYMVKACMKSRDIVDLTLNQ